MRPWLVLLVIILTAAGFAFAQQEREAPPGFKSLFNGKDLTGWKVHNGKKDVWGSENGLLYVKGGGGGWLMTEEEFGNFELRMEYRLPMKGNSGVALRSPMEGNPAYAGMEIQLIDDENWTGLQPWQNTGSIYDVVPAAKKANKPLGEWNQLRIVANGRKVAIEFNGEKLVDADLDDHKNKFEKHPGLKREKGHIGLQSYNVRVDFRRLFLRAL